MKRSLVIIMTMVLMTGIMTFSFSGCSSPSSTSQKPNPECEICGKTVDDCPYNGKHPSNNMPQEQINRVLSELEENMVWVEGGTFMMGATPEQGNNVWDKEKPVHQVTLSGYYICKYEVTQELWQAVMGNNPSHFSGMKCPVESVSWDECQTFIAILNKLTGKKYRLPTEAEWEYAARGGNKSKGYKYAGSNDINAVAWYGNADGRTHPVGEKKPNELGLYDMSGNVLELCHDIMGSYDSEPQTNPTGKTGSYDHVQRGGCWGIEAPVCRVSFRLSIEHNDRGTAVGLRLAMDE